MKSRFEPVTPALHRHWGLFLAANRIICLVCVKECDGSGALSDAIQGNRSIAPQNLIPYDLYAFPGSDVAVATTGIVWLLLVLDSAAKCNTPPEDRA